MAPIAAIQDTPTMIRSSLTRHGLPGVPWYLILDAAQDAASPARARDSGLKTQSLYAGELGGRLDHVAPHLCTFDLMGAFANWLFDHWRGNHGILLQSKSSFEELRRHFRQFLLVKDEQGSKYRLRFYDPRVLRAFIPACSPEEATSFLGPVACYYAAGRFGITILAFAAGPRGAIARDLTALDAKSPSAQGGGSR